MDADVALLDALAVLLAEVEASIDHGDPVAYVGVEAAVARLTADCDDPRIGRLEYAPHRVELEANEDGELEPIGGNELLDAEWDKTGSYWCRGCDTELHGELAAKAHVRGIDLMERDDG